MHLDISTNLNQKSTSYTLKTRTYHSKTHTKSHSSSPFSFSFHYFLSNETQTKTIIQNLKIPNPLKFTSYTVKTTAFIFWNQKWNPIPFPYPQLSQTQAETTIMHLEISNNLNQASTSYTKNDKLTFQNNKHTHTHTHKSISSSPFSSSFSTIFLATKHKPRQ